MKSRRRRQACGFRSRRSTLAASDGLWHFSWHLLRSGGRGEAAPPVEQHLAHPRLIPDYSPTPITRLRMNRSDRFTSPSEADARRSPSRSARTCSSWIRVPASTIAVDRIGVPRRTRRPVDESLLHRGRCDGGEVVGSAHPPRLCRPARGDYVVGDRDPDRVEVAEVTQTGAARSEQAHEHPARRRRLARQADKRARPRAPSSSPADSMIERFSHMLTTPETCSASTPRSMRSVTCIGSPASEASLRAPAGPGSPRSPSTRAVGLTASKRERLTGLVHQRSPNLRPLDGSYLPAEPPLDSEMRGRDGIQQAGEL